MTAMRFHGGAADVLGSVQVANRGDVMRITMGGFMHETNTFVAAPTTWDDFARAGPWPGATEGPAILSAFRGLNLGIAHVVDNGEGALLERVRGAVGDTPILVSLDLHANVSPRMAELADFISSYRTYPHVDWGPTGGRTIDWLDRVLSWNGR